MLLKVPKTYVMKMMIMILMIDCLDYSMNMNEIVTMGVNYYINSATRLQVNYQYKVESYEIDNDALLVQLQVKF